MLQLFSLLFFSIIFNEANAGLLIKTYIELLYFTSAYNIILLHRFFWQSKWVGQHQFSSGCPTQFANFVQKVAQLYDNVLSSSKIKMAALAAQLLGINFK